MNTSTLVGPIAAILLTGSLSVGALDAFVPKVAIITVCGIAAALEGFAPVMVAAFIVILEERIISQQPNDELRVIGELADETGQPTRNIRSDRSRSASSGKAVALVAYA